MNKKNYFYLLIGLWLLPLTGLQSQKEVKLAEKQIEMCEYGMASKTLQPYVNSNQTDAYAVLLLAESLFKSGKIQESIPYYEKYGTLHPSDKTMCLNLGHALKMSGKFTEAKIMYLRYSSVSPALAAHYAESCNEAIHLIENSTDPVIYPLAMNNSMCDFAPSIWNDGLVFCSFVPQKLNADALKVAKNSKGFTLVYSDMEGKDAKVLHNGINFTYNRGAISKTDNNKCAFTLYAATLTPSARPIATVMYLGEVDGNNNLYNITPFDYNELGTINCDPYLTDGGKTLYFSSNRSGGFGGFDLYVCTLEGNHWSMPVNLGSEINTPGNEITPNFSNDKLYFASDYHFGLGGYDLFSCQFTGSEWYNVQNLGAGINSAENDYFPCVDHNNMLYFTSTRRSGKGSDDIYYTSLPDRSHYISLEGEEVNELESKVIASNVQKEEILDDVTEVGNNIESDVPKAVYIADYLPNIAVAKLPNNNVNLVSQKVNMAMDYAAPIHVVSHEDLAENTPPPAFKIPDFSARSINMDEMMSGARRVSFNEMMTPKIAKKTMVYFIQLAAMYGTRPNFDRFRVLTKYGNIYKVFINKSVKVRLGYFENVNEAQAILARVRGEGFKDAFMVTDDLSISELELVLSGSDQFNGGKVNENFGYNKELPVSDTPEYKVRLASYEDPIWFETEKVKDLGKIENWKKGTWTIFILSGFSSFEEADQARIKAINRGYADAEVVIDNGGIIERLKKN